MRGVLIGYAVLAFILLIAFTENQYLYSCYVEIDTRHSGIRVKIVALLLALKPNPEYEVYHTVQCPAQRLVLVQQSSKW